MEVTTSELRLLSRVAHVSVRGKRRIFLEELNLKKGLVKIAKYLAVDP